mgnify:CR=1 FL=1
MSDKHIQIIKSLPIWKGKIEIRGLKGGLTNQNYLVKDDDNKLVVRLGEDIIEHNIIRSNEVLSSKAAFDAGIAPEVIYHSNGILVLNYIEGKTLSNLDVRKNIDKIIHLVKKVHYDVPKKLFGPAMIFWVFHVIRNYINFLENKKSNYSSILNELASNCEILEGMSSPYQIVYGHNDLLPANFLDDGSRLWLIDWEYSGFNSPLFDLGGLASNNNFSPDEENYLLENYFDKKINSELQIQYSSMKCASLLRETMWSMVSEITSEIDFDYKKYTQENLNKYQESFKKLEI